METRVAVIGIIIENNDMIENVNSLLSENAEHIVSRMGVPYRKRNVNIITVTIDAPMNVISALSGKLGRLEGVTAKAIYSNIK